MSAAVWCEDAGSSGWRDDHCLPQPQRRQWIQGKEATLPTTARRSKVTKTCDHSRKTSPCRCTGATVPRSALRGTRRFYGALRRTWSPGAPPAGTSSWRRAAAIHWSVSTTVTWISSARCASTGNRRPPPLPPPVGLLGRMQRVSPVPQGLERLVSAEGGALVLSWRRPHLRPGGLQDF